MLASAILYTHTDKANFSETNWKYTVEVPNTAPISKDISFHVSKFPEKMVFQIMFEIVMWIRQLQPAGKLFQTIGVKYGNFFDKYSKFLEGCFSFETEDLVQLYLLHFDQIFYIYHENVEDEFP